MILESIKALHTRRKLCDISHILNTAAIAAGYRKYDAFNVSDNDLNNGLQKLLSLSDTELDEVLLKSDGAFSGYYEGKLV